MNHLGQVLVAFIITLGSLSTFAFESTKLPVEAFFKKPALDSVRISPNGKYLAARALVNGNKNIIIIERGTNKHIQTLNFSGDDNEVGMFGWLSNERVYASMVTKVGPLDQPAMTGYLFAANIDGSKRRQLLPKPGKPGRASGTPVRFSIINRLKSDPDYILLSMGIPGSSKSEIIKLNIFNGNQRLIASSPYERNSFGIDNNAKVRVLTAYDSEYKFVSVYHRENDEQEWQEVAKFDSDSATFDVMDFTPDNNKFFYYSKRKKEESGVYLFNPKDKSSVLVHKLEGDQEIVSYLYDDKNVGLVGIVREKGRLVKEYFKGYEAEASYQIALDSAFPNDYVNILNYTSDKNIALLLTQSDRNPGTFFLFDKNKNKVEFVMPIRPKLKAKLMAERKPVSFKARDGLEIRGLLTIPQGRSKNLPMVLLVHGGPYGISDDWLFDTEAQFLANRGYLVFQVNYRGSGGRGKEFVRNAYRQVGKEMQDDLTDATHWAIEEGYADKDRVCIYGASYGGYASLMGVVREPELYKCAIGYAGVYDITVQAEESDTRMSKYGRKFLEDAWNAYDEKFVRERSAAYHVDKIKAALFLVHGKNDKRTPLSNYEILAKALDEIDYPYEKMIKSFEGHGFSDENNQFELYEKMERFLDKHIGR